MPRVAPAEQQLDALAHLLRGLVGERDREDLARPGAFGSHEPGDPVREHAGLARAGAGEDQQRALAVRDRLALRLVEPGEERVDVAWQRCPAWTPNRSDLRGGVGGRQRPRDRSLRAWACATTFVLTPPRSRRRELRRDRRRPARRRRAGPAARPRSGAPLPRGPPEDVAAYLLALDTINFGSGWFPTLRKRPGSSGYFTVAWALADRFRARGPWSNAELRALTAREVARHPRPGARARADGALRPRARRPRRLLGERTALEAIADAGGSAERLAEQLAAGMPFFDDRGLLQARPDRRQRPRARRRRRRSTTSTA